jgi:pseudaminic acid cytidylyltransferase
MTDGTYAIIPARGGSKRIPRKNIKDFMGMPMIAYPIQKLIESKIFDAIYVSTDDPEIAKVAEEFGAKVPFLRAPELSGDSVLTVPVISDFISRESIPSESIVACVYATTPLIQESDLRLAYQIALSSTNFDYVCAVTKYRYPIQRSLRRLSNHYYEMVQMENLSKFSQQLEERFHDAGQFYFARAKTWLSEKPMLVNTIGIELPTWRVQDIDTPEDWEHAEKLYGSLNYSK